MKYPVIYRRMHSAALTKPTWTANFKAVTLTLGSRISEIKGMVNTDEDLDRELKFCQEALKKAEATIMQPRPNLGKFLITLLKASENLDAAYIDMDGSG